MKNKILFKRIISKALIIGLCLSNIPMYSFANEINIEKTKSSTIGTWTEGVTSIPSNRTGGFRTETVNGKIYVIGGYSNYSQPDSCIISADVYASVSKPDLCTDPANIVSSRSLSLDGTVEVYDPETNQWETKKPMPTPRKNFGCVAIGDKIYCVGGETENGTLLKTVEVYDTRNNSWDTSKASMTIANADFGCVAVNNKIYCIGGSASTWAPLICEKVYEYDTTLDKWTEKVHIPADGKAEFVAEAIGEKIYCVGGRGEVTSTDNTLYIYDTTKDTWDKTKTPAQNPKKNNSGVIAEGKVYSIGGYVRDYDTYKYVATDTAEYYNPISNTWTSISSMPTKKADFSSEYVNGKIYCIGGNDGYNVLTTIDVYTLPSNEPAPIEPETISNNIDIYIKPKNNLSLTLDTNHVTFEDFDGVDDMIKESAINLTIESSLPYKIDASLETEIQNENGTNILDKSILGIKSNDSDTYKTFTTIKTPITLLDNQHSGESNIHSIDLKLNKGVNYKIDVYKTVLKFEVVQK